MPNRIPDTNIFFWLHVLGLLVGLALSTATFKRLWALGSGPEPVDDTRAGTPDQRAMRIVKVIVPSLIVFAVVYLSFALWLFPDRTPTGNDTFARVSLLLAGLWLGHDLYRGVIHPWTTRNRQPQPIRRIAPTSPLPMMLFAFLAASHLGGMTYPSDWASDPRFVGGVTTMAVGLAVNQVVDARVRRRRRAGHRAGSMPPSFRTDFTGELIFWVGWTVAAWSLAGLVRAIYQAAVFIPLARAHRHWRADQTGPDQP